MATAPAASQRGQPDFIEAVVKPRDAYNRAANDMAKGGVRADRKRLICAAVPALQVSGWEGKVYSPSSNSDGKGVIELLIGPDVYVKTWNNSLSDIGDHTLIEPNSPVFNTSESMKRAS